MKIEEIQAFIESCDVYFSTMTKNELKLGIPKIVSENGKFHEYTGIVDIRGSMTGNIIFSANREMLKSLGEEIIGAPIDDPELIESVVGEIANTISGNAQKAFGQGFTIDVPRILYDASPQSVSGKQIRVPLEWNNYSGVLILGIE